MAKLTPVQKDIVVGWQDKIRKAELEVIIGGGVNSRETAVVAAPSQSSGSVGEPTAKAMKLSVVAAAKPSKASEFMSPRVAQPKPSKARRSLARFGSNASIDSVTERLLERAVMGSESEAFEGNEPDGFEVPPDPEIAPKEKVICLATCKTPYKYEK